MKALAFAGGILLSIVGVCGSAPAAVNTAQGGSILNRWIDESTGCATSKIVAAETGLRVELTPEAMLIGVMGPASSASGTEVQLSVWADGNTREATRPVGQLVEHNGVQWLDFSVLNDEPGGWHDLIANAQSISVAYGRPRQTVTVSLAGSNAVMARLRACAERAARVSAAPAPARAAATYVAAPSPGGPAFRAPTADERAGGANANCVIRVAAGRFEGPCKFTPDNGSFSVEHPNGMPMIGNVHSFWIEADTRTAARLTGSDPEAGSQDYGIVTRRSASEACWTNRTASLCAYAL